MESVTMLMAAGSFGNEEIIPILIDLDVRDDNVERCCRLMDMYRAINKSVFPESNPADSEPAGFFSARTKALSERINVTTCHHDFSRWSIIDPYLLDSTLSELRHIIYPHLYNPNHILSYSLFGDGHAYRRYVMDDIVGIYGDMSKTRMLYGLYDVWHDMDMCTWLQMVCPGDKIVAVGSTFGCTSIVGMLDLLKIYRKYDHVFRYVEKAFVFLEPYFLINNLPPIAERDQEYNDETFVRRSQIFYTSYKESADIAKTTYRICCNGQPMIREYSATEARQTYKSSPSELAAAIAIMDFAASDHRSTDSLFTGIQAGNLENIHDLLTIDGLNPTLSYKISCDLGYLSISAYCNDREDFLNNLHNNHGIIHLLHLDGTEICDVMRNISDFTKYYIEWWKELEESSHGQLEIFDFHSNSLNNIIRGRRLSSGLLSIFLASTHSSYLNEFRRGLTHLNAMDNSSVYAKILEASKMAAIKITERPFRMLQDN